MPVSSRPVDRQVVSIEWIAERILTEWSKEDLAFVKSNQHDFGMIGRSIRNDYGLWEFDHPLTQHWHAHPDCRNVVDGIDCSEDHPDAVSAEVLRIVRERLGPPDQEPLTLRELLAGIRT